MAGFLSVTTGGPPRDMGVDFGRAVADVLAELRAGSARSFRKETGRTFAGAVRYAARHFLPFVRRRYAAYLEELAGIAEGSRIPFEELFLLTAEEELFDIWGGYEHCSSAIVRTRRGAFLLHNEDYPPYYRDRLVIVHAEPKGRPAFLCLTYPYILAGPSCGLNDAGLAFAVNSLSFRPLRRGIPTNYLLRDLYGVRSLGAVRGALDVPSRLMGNCVVALAEGGEGIAVEFSTAGIDVMRMGAAGVFPHTNHAVSRRLDRAGEKPSWNSRVRLAALEHLLGKAGPGASVRDLESVLSSRKYGLLRLPRRSSDACTIASTVVDPGRGLLYVAKRGVTGQRFRPYRLRR